MTFKNHGGRSIRFFPSLSGLEDSGHYLHMFREDVHNLVVPYKDRESQKLFFKIDPLQKDYDAYLSVLNSFSQHDTNEISEAICNAVRQIAFGLVDEGVSRFEIILDKANPSFFYLGQFTSKRLLKSPFGYIQFLPPEERRRYKKNINYIPRKAVWTISIPDSLGGQRGFKKVLTQLQNHDGLGPKFWREDLERNEINFDFHFPEYLARQKVRQFLNTKKWGWHGRDYSQENATEFFVIFRNIKFRCALADLRDHIVFDLNNLFEMLQLNSRIFLSEQKTSGELNSILKDFTIGKIPTSEIFKIVRS